MSNVAALRDKAAILGGHPLKPKRHGEKTSLAFTFDDRSIAEQFCEWARNVGAQVALRGTYGKLSRACLVTAEV